MKEHRTPEKRHQSSNVVIALSPVLIAVIAALTWMILVPEAAAQPVDGLRGTLVVLNKRGHDASFVDLGSGELVATLPTGRGPHELAMTSDGFWAIGTDYSGGNSLTVFDVANLQVARTIDLSDYPNPHGILLSEDEQQVIVTSETSNTLLVIDFHSGEIDHVITTNQGGSHMVAVSEDSSVAYTSNMRSDSVSVIDLEAARFDRTFAVPARPEAITTNRAGTEVWVGSNDTGLVSLFDVESGERLAQWSGFGWPYRILLTHDERYAIIPDLGNDSLRFFDVNSKSELGRLDLPGMSPQGVVLHPNDRTLFLSLSGDNRVLVIDVTTREILGDYAAGSAPDGIAYSPLVLLKTIDRQ